MNESNHGRPEGLRIYSPRKLLAMSTNTLTARGARISPRIVVELLAAFEVEVAQLNARQSKAFTLHGRKLTPEAALNAIVADYLSLTAEERHAILSSGLRSVERMLDTEAQEPADRARLAVPASQQSPRAGKLRKAKRA